MEIRKTKSYQILPYADLKLASLPFFPLLHSNSFAHSNHKSYSKTLAQKLSVASHYLQNKIKASSSLFYH